MTGRTINIKAFATLAIVGFNILGCIDPVYSPLTDYYLYSPIPSPSPSPLTRSAILPLPPFTYAVTPASGSWLGGDLVTLDGMNYDLTTSINIGGAACTPVTLLSSNQLQCTTGIRSFAGLSPVITSNLPAGGASTLLAGFQYLNPNPTLNSVTPNLGDLFGGDSITIAGTFLLFGADVRVDGKSCLSPQYSPNPNSASTITCKTPPMTTRPVDHLNALVTVSNPTPTVAQGTPPTLNFNYYIPNPQPNSASPLLFPDVGGTTVKITGSKFVTPVGVTIGGAPCATPSVTNPLQPTGQTITCVAGPFSNGAITITNNAAAGTTLAQPQGISDFSVSAYPATSLLLSAQTRNNTLSTISVYPNPGMTSPVFGRPLPSPYPYTIPNDITSVLVHPTRAILYISHGTTTNGVSRHYIKPVTVSPYGTGAIFQTTGSTENIANNPTLLLTDPTDTIVYVITKSTGEMRPYSINKAEDPALFGKLSFVPAPLPSASPSPSPSPQVYAIGTKPVGAVITPGGKYLVVATHDDTKLTRYYFDASNGGVLTNPSPMPSVYATPLSDAQTLITDPSGRFFYTVNKAQNTLGWIYPDGGTSGAISSQGTSPVAIVMDRTGSYLYVANTDSNTIGQFVIDSAAGTPSPMPTPTVALDLGENPKSLAIDPSGLWLYVGYANISSLIGRLKINQSTGALTLSLPLPLPSPSSGSPYIASILNPRKYAFITDKNNPRLYQIELNNISGKRTGVFSITNLPAIPTSVAVDPSGRFLFVATQNGAMNQYSILANGTLLPNSPSSFLIDSTSTIGSSLIFDPQGKFAYLLYPALGKIGQFSLNRETGVLTPTTTISTYSFPTSIAVDATSRYLYVANYKTSTSKNVISRFDVNRVTGALPTTPSQDFDSACANTGQITQIAIDPTNSYLFALCGGTKQLFEYSISSGAIAELVSGISPPNHSPIVSRCTGFPLSQCYDITNLNATSAVPTGMALDRSGRNIFILFGGSTSYIMPEPMFGGAVAIDPNSVQATLSEKVTVIQPSTFLDAPYYTAGNATFSGPYYMNGSTTSEPLPAAGEGEANGLAISP